MHFDPIFPLFIFFFSIFLSFLSFFFYVNFMSICFYQWFYCQCQFRYRDSVIRRSRPYSVGFHRTKAAFSHIGHRHSETRAHYMNKLNKINTFTNELMRKKNSGIKRWEQFASQTLHQQSTLHRLSVLKFYSAIIYCYWCLFELKLVLFVAFWMD